MTIRGFHPLFARLGRCLLVAVLAAAYLGGAVGFPVPVRLTSSSTGETSPAQVRACGCGAGDSCSGCCGCCKQTPAAEDADADGCPECGATSPPAPLVHWVIGVQERQCRGLSTLWLSWGVSLPAAPPVAVTRDATPAGTTDLPELKRIAIAVVPDIPPPRA
ncbi:MAG: hypothetical protein U0736_06175 [Gemmataceae bacterium]